MKITETKLPGALLIEPDFFEDNRGYFSMTFRKDILEAHGIKDNFVQENESLSCADTVRGLHYQKNPWAQSKLVRVANGKALDVIVDLRRQSETFGQWASFILDGKNALYIPEGFAHGFRALEDFTLLQYKCGVLYNKESERGIRWNDPDLNINWEIGNLIPILSEKDKSWPYFKEVKDFF